MCPARTFLSKNIDTYIEENRATIRRMFGEISQPEALPISSHQEILNDSLSYNKANRIARSNHLNLNQDNKIDSCESLVEIITPYWAANSGGKIRAIVNTQHLQQAIQQEMCRKTQTKRCNNDCGCEQKYKWHRLLAYDPDDNCKGIFMDWFLFPSCCVCRCSNIFPDNHKN
ncbi:protein spaetzle 3-like isoform X2 [Brevipalpus obovatus]|uniref:protein spaetzle 3-like isoform X2 n=1 Tax=Brevipalpus obovatus TaxID=246614 RepID=UPI003D9EEB36